MRQKTIKSPKIHTRIGDPVWEGTRIELASPERLVLPDPWVGHIPFAFYLVEALHPRIVVELGVHTGNSYCAFAQAVAKLRLKCRCFGVDHWKGDHQTGIYDDFVFQELRAYHDPRYGSFSTLLRMPFNDALRRMRDASIDLIHIDGCHTYEEVKGDFDNWLPKLSSRGVVLLHDIDVHSGDFEVWRLWEEIRGRFPSFSFLHSHGLGVSYVGSDVPPPGLGMLLDTAGNAKAEERARQYFARLGGMVSDHLVASTAGVTEAAIEARAEAAERRSKEIAAEYTTASHALNLMAEVRADLAHRLDELNTWAINLDEQRLALIKELAARDTHIAELEAARADLTRQLSETRAHEKLLDDLDALKRQIEEIRAEAMQAASQIAEFEATRPDLARQLEHAFADAAKLLSDREAIDRQVEDVRRQVAHAASQITEHEAMRANLTGQITELEAVRSNLTGQLEHARAAATDQITELEAMRADLTGQLEHARASAAEFFRGSRRAQATNRGVAVRGHESRQSNRCARGRTREAGRLA